MLEKKADSQLKSKTTSFDEDEVIHVKVEDNRLSAEQMDKDIYEKCIESIHHRLKDFMGSIATYDFAGQSWGKNHGDSSKLNLVEQIIHFLFLLVAAFMFSRAAHVALRGVPHAEMISLIVACVSVFLVDWQISEFVSFLRLRNNSQNTLADIKKKATPDGNKLSQHRNKVQKEIVEDVQGEYLSNKNLIMICIMSSIGILFLLVEYAAAIYYIEKTGYSLDWMSYVVSLLAVVITVILGFYKGYHLDYPKKRQLLALKYGRILANMQHIPKSFEFKFEVAILNKLTNYLLSNPRPSEKEFNEYEKKLRLNEIYRERKLAEIRHIDENEKLNAELRQEREKSCQDIQGVFHDQELEDKALKKCNLVYDEKRQSMKQKHEKELELIDRRIIDHGDEVRESTDQISSSERPVLESSVESPFSQNGHNHGATHQTYVSLVDKD
jgi:hypothetical protein